MSLLPCVLFFVNWNLQERERQLPTPTWRRPLGSTVALNRGLANCMPPFPNQRVLRYFSKTSIFTFESLKFTLSTASLIGWTKSEENIKTSHSQLQLIDVLHFQLPKQYKASLFPSHFSEFKHLHCHSVEMNNYNSHVLELDTFALYDTCACVRQDVHFSIVNFLMKELILFPFSWDSDLLDYM